MFDLIIILAIIAGLIGLILMWKLVKGAFKMLFFLLGVAMLFVLVLFSFVYFDYADLKENLPNSSKVIIITDNRSILTGFITTNFTDIKDQKPLSNYDIGTLSLAYATERYDLILGDNYILFMIDINVFNNSIENGVTIPMDENSNFTIDKKAIYKIFYSNDSSDLLLEEMAKRIIVKEGYEFSKPQLDLVKKELRKSLEKDGGKFDDYDAKNTLLIFIISDMMQEEGLKPAIDALKNKMIRVYPKSSFFSAITYSSALIPDSIIEKLIRYNNVYDSVKEAK